MKFSRISNNRNCIILATRSIYNNKNNNKNDNNIKTTTKCWSLFSTHTTHVTFNFHHNSENSVLSFQCLSIGFLWDEESYPKGNRMLVHPVGHRSFLTCSFSMVNLTTTLYSRPFVCSYGQCSLPKQGRNLYQCFSF